jgi:hypothetical protein
MTRLSPARLGALAVLVCIALILSLSATTVAAQGNTLPHMPARARREPRAAERLVT